MFFNNKVLVTGGCGFIGSHYIESLIEKYPNCEILNIDLCTYAVSQQTIDELDAYKNYTLKKININKLEDVKKAVLNFDPGLIVNFAAESHVDNSIENPNLFLETNIIGCSNLMLAILEQKNRAFFHHISTDEVFGDLDFDEKNLFNEESVINPSSPYAASKASAELVIKSFNRTYGINYLVTNCGNNFGPRQHEEKLIPKCISKLIAKKKIGIYGKGENIRDWIYVKDHADILLALQEMKITNDSVNIGMNNEKTNIEIVKALVSIIHDNKNIDPLDYIEFSKDRPGHDKRYALDNSKLQELIDLDSSNFISQLQETVSWFKKNQVIDG